MPGSYARAAAPGLTARYAGGTLGRCQTASIATTM